MPVDLHCLYIDFNKAKIPYQRGRDLALLKLPMQPTQNDKYAVSAFADWDEETQRYHAMHHPFTSPKPGQMELFSTQPGAVKANAYDLVLNGIKFSLLVVVSTK